MTATIKNKVTSLSCSDNAIRYSTEEDTFFDTLDMVVEDTVYHDISSKDVRILGLTEGPLFVGDNRKAAKIPENISDEAVLETASMNGSRFAVLYRKEGLEETGSLLSPAASASLVNKLGCACPAWSKLPLHKKEEWVDDAIKACPKKELFLIERNGKIRGVASNRYNVVPQNKVLNIVREYLNENFEDVEFRGGTITHELTSCSWAINDEKLLKKYKTFLHSNGFVNLDDAVIEVSADTSDTTDAACKVDISITDVNQGFEMLLGSPVSMAHLKNASEEAWKRSIAGIGHHIDDFTTMLTRLGGIKIYYPLHCFSNIAISAGLSNKQVSDVLDSAEDLLEYTDDYSAHDVYFLLFSMLSALKKDIAPATYVKVYENLSRCLHPAFDWTAYDVKKA